ncbi:hypothetical protein N783_04825 [Pontibacillus marinus BH030004 = DSM 16465]|uniref:Uncharacterized protein n=1 Tax=Pontibacillus marinus BH030004 = DSM 16465 TaxID=1385511 RepID=A0A0A5GCF4_9BACI|nr:hypothetical protein N783_04825 [Pontibacillus marinus BH030004 = DSM 16465]
MDVRIASMREAPEYGGVSPESRAFAPVPGSGSPEL